MELLTSFLKGIVKLFTGSGSFLRNLVMALANLKSNPGVFVTFFVTTITGLIKLGLMQWLNIELPEDFEVILVEYLVPVGSYVATILLGFFTWAILKGKNLISPVPEVVKESIVKEGLKGMDIGSKLN